MSKKRYAVCGLSARANGMFIRPMISTFEGHCEIVALLDVDPKRFENAKRKAEVLADVPEYYANEFDRMIEETKPDVVIVAGTDSSHADQIVRALEYDLDVISEKPMVTNSEEVRRVLEAQEKSKGKAYVAFNYRYMPIHMKIKEMMEEGKVGRVTSIDLNWYIDTYHGASYFKRWNRSRENSGGLSIHKSTHHFDLVNWWIDQKPEQVFAYGALNYYGADGELNPKREDGRHCSTCHVKQDCTYVMRWTTRSKEVVPEDDHLTNIAANSTFTNYRGDKCIFDSEIDIEDTYVASIRYDEGAMLSYSVNFSAPYEGYRLAINGTKGRIETMEYHSPKRVPFPTPVQTIDYFPLFGSKETIHVVPRSGGHGGGDPVLQEDLFLGPDPHRPYEILSGAEDGAYSVLVGEAVWKSARDNEPIRIEDLLKS